FGATATAPVDCAVLEYRNGEFVQLGHEEVARRIHPYPETVERVALPAAATASTVKPWRASTPTTRTTI
ncbi:MAG TPA: hypothetical protein VIH11_06170, partial [Gemmatimonadaceae bacterium]